MEAVRTSETSVYSKTTRRYIPEGSQLHTRRCENLETNIYNNHSPTSGVFVLKTKAAGKTQEKLKMAAVNCCLSLNRPKTQTNWQVY
jgi:hypothetical protein